MPLILALKNRDSLVVATDIADASDGPDRFGQFIPLPGRTVLLIAGNLPAVRHAVMDVALPKIDPQTSAAAVAAGSIAAVSQVLGDRSFADSSASQLQVLAKECLAATKLRWPTALGNHMRLGVISFQNMRFQDF